MCVRARALLAVASFAGCAQQAPSSRKETIRALQQYYSAGTVNESAKVTAGSLLTGPSFFLLQSLTKNARHGGTPHNRAGLDYVGVPSSSQRTKREIQ